jgi:spore germination protein GerM
MTYLSDLVLKNEEVQKFPKDLLSASMRWIRSWFLEDDPVTKTVVESTAPTVAKEAVLEAKLRELLKNPQFEQELRAQLATYETHRPRLKNVVDNAKIEAQGNVRLGDTGITDSGTYDEKNVVKGGSISGNDVHIGDVG